MKKKKKRKKLRKWKTKIQQKGATGYIHQFAENSNKIDTRTIKEKSEKKQVNNIKHVKRHNYVLRQQRLKSNKRIS